MIRKNDKIGGIKIADEEILLSQFADDTTFFLDGSRESFKAPIHFHVFASGSAASRSNPADLTSASGKYICTCVTRMSGGSSSQCQGRFVVASTTK